MKPWQMMRGFGQAASGGGGHAYWRIYVTATSTTDGFFCTIAEIEARATVGGADQCSGGTATSGTSYSGQGPALAFDNSATTVWSTVSTASPDWIAYQFPAPVSVAEVAITSGGTSARALRAPKDFQIQWSDDGSSWTTAKTVTGEVSWGVTQTRTFTVP